MGFIQVFIIKLDKFDALILLESWKLFELLAEEVNPEFHRSFFIKVIESLKIFSFSNLTIFKYDAL